MLFACFPPPQPLGFSPIIQTTRPRPRQITFARWIIIRGHMRRGRSVSAGAGRGGRQRAAGQRAIAGARRFALADIIRILDAGEKPSRSGRLALLVTGESAVAQPRIFVSPKAE